MKKIFKSRIFAFILGAIIFGGIVGVSAYTIFANDIGYTPKDSTWKKSNGEDITNVQDAIDDLHTKAKPEYTGSTTVTPTTSSQTLSTKNTILTKDITIDPIPSSYTEINQYISVTNGRMQIQNNSLITSGFTSFKVRNVWNNGATCSIKNISEETWTESSPYQFNTIYNLNDNNRIILIATSGQCDFYVDFYK